MKSRQQNVDLQLADEKLAQAFYSNGRYNAVFLGATGVGFVVIYLLTSFNIFGETPPQLSYISGAIFFLEISQFPLLSLARRRKGIATNILATVFVAIFAILLTAFWEGIVPIAIIVVMITTAMATSDGDFHWPAEKILLARFRDHDSVPELPRAIRYDGRNTNSCKSL